MLIRNATYDDIIEALNQVNAEFDGNIKTKRFDHAGKTRQGGDKYNVTLSVNDSRAKGGRRGRSGRRIAAACWHAYGTFRDYLPEGTEVISNTAKGRDVEHPGDPWQDWNIGSAYYPFYYSDACDC